MDSRKTTPTALVHRVVMRGWRYFRCDGCDGCDAHFREPSRDCGTPSGVDCYCGEWLSPYDGQPDESLPYDKNTGNLHTNRDRERLA